MILLALLLFKLVKAWNVYRKWFVNESFTLWVFNLILL